MKKILLLLVLLIVVIGALLFVNKKYLVKNNQEQKGNDISMINKEVPIIDRSLFFGNPNIAGADISPDGKKIAFLKEYNGIMNIWVKNAEEPFDNARPLTNSTRPLYGFFWTDDSKYIVYAKDNDGDENTSIYAVNPLEGDKDNLPKSKDLTPKKDVKTIIYNISENDPNIIMIGLNDRDKAWHDLYKLNIDTGKLEKIYTNTSRITGYIFDWDDNLRILERTDEKGSSELFKIDDKGKLTKIYEVPVTEEVYIAGWNEDNTKAYLVTNKGALNLSTLFLLDMNDLSLTKIESDPENKVDFGSLFLDKNTRKVISTSYVDDKIKRYWKDKSWEKNYEYLQSKFPDREISFSSFTKDYSKILVNISGDRFADETYLFIPDAKDDKSKLIFQYTSRPELKKIEKYLSPMKPIKYKSSDALEISGYLTIPVNKEAKNLSLVVYVHGGPKGPRDYWGYDPVVQFLANRGYAVLQPNFRASGGYGKSFLNAGDLEWGKLMQDDITYGVKYLIDEGIVDKDKVVIMGGSYGGYATLAGLAFTPDLYAAGVDIVGPSNLFTLLESIPPYWEAGRAFLYGMVGDPSTEEGKKRIKEASPLFSVDKINKPLLIIQGKNDPRVKQAESDQIVVALREKGKRVDYLLADDEGHGFAKPINRMAMFVEIEKFLANILGGRYQEDAPADVAKRLKEITVDVNSVSVKK